MSYLTHIQHEGLGARDGLYPCTGITIWDGPYGSGKTIAQDAVRLAMTGSTRDIKTIGRLRETLWRVGSPSVMACVEIDETEIQREYSDSQSLALDPPVPGLGKNIKLHQFHIDNTFGGPPVTADLQEISDLSPEKFNAWILQKIRAEDVDIPATINRALNAIPTEDLSDAQREALSVALSDLLAGNRQGKLSASEYIQVLEEKAREFRNTEVALLHDAQASRRDSARLSTAIPALAQAIADLQQQLETAKTEHEATVKSVGEQEERHARIQAIKARITTAEERLETLRNIPEDWNPERKAEDAKRILAAIKLAEEASANVNRGNRAEAESLAAIEVHSKAIGQWLAHSLERGELLLEEAKSDLEKAADRVLSLMQRDMIRCPKCKHEFQSESVEKELETAKRNRVNQETRHRDRLAAVEQERQVPGDHFLNDKELLRLQDCRAQLAAEEKTLENIQRKLLLAKQKEEEAVEAVRALLIEFLGTDYDENQDVVEQAEAQAKLWNSMLTAIQSRDMTRNQKQADEQELAGLATCNPQDLRDLEAAQKQAVQGLESGIRLKQGELQAAQKSVSDEERIQALESRVETWKLVVEIVQAVRQEIVEGALQGLAGTVNAMLDCVAIGAVLIQDGAFVLQNPDGTRQWVALSSGEKALVGIAIAAALAEKRGPQKLQAISIDNCECVGQERLPDLLGIASCIWERFRVQCLIAGHFDGAQLEINNRLPNCTVHDLRVTVAA